MQHLLIDFVSHKAIQTMRTRSQARIELERMASGTSTDRNSANANNSSSITVASLSDVISDKVECPICYECPNLEDITSICGCKHQFCFECIDRWGQNKNTCPLCNGVFTKVIRGSKTVAEDKTYSGNKRKRDDTEADEHMAAIRARIEENEVRRAELQRQIEAIIQQRDLLRMESEQIRVRIELHRLRMESMRMQTAEFILQRIEIERLIARIGAEIAHVDNAMALANNSTGGNQS